MEDDIIKQNEFFEHAKYILDPNIHKFLYVLVKYLFMGKKIMSRTKKKLADCIAKLNREDFKITILNNDRCDINDFKIIFKFIKTQNNTLVSEIFENIIIRVLSFAFKTKKEDFFGKYLYNDLEALKKNYDFFIHRINNTLLSSLFNGNNECEYLDVALKSDEEYMISKPKDERERMQINDNFKNSTFLQILSHITKSKIFIDNSNNNSEQEDNKLETSQLLLKDNDNTNIYSLLSNLFFGKDIGVKKRDNFLTNSVSILISSYIYHRNNISPLMGYSQNKDNLENLPFSFDISEAGINDIYINTILSPIRIEPRVSNIELNHNRINIYGMFELHKLLMFNKNIKKISIKSCETKSKSLNTFNDNYIVFNNYNVEKLDISSNYLKSDSDTNLSNLIIHLKGLKCLVLSNNILKSGLGYFFVTLKNLYRKNQSKLEELYLNNCELDDISFYELGELLKSKYCKLKCLCLNENKIPSNINFFRALKKNNSLEEIYFYGCGINSEKTDEIERVISNTDLQTLYIYGNQIHDFNQYIRIIYRTNLVKNEQEKNNNFINNSILFNLNMNNIDSYNQNGEKINVLFEGIKKTNLIFLDLSSVLKNINNEELKLNLEYKSDVNKIVEYLSEKLKEYKQALREILETKSNKLNEKFDDEDIKDFKKFEKKILNIINSQNFLYDRVINNKINKLISYLNIKNKEERDEKNKTLRSYILSKRKEILLQNKKMILI